MPSSIDTLSSTPPTPQMPKCALVVTDYHRLIDEKGWRMENLRERLRRAYENVAFAGDSTWSCTEDDYRQMNRKLIDKENSARGYGCKKYGSHPKEKKSKEELWELPEVEELYERMIGGGVEPQVSCESVFLKANTLEERILKARITDDKIKRIWNQKINFDLLNRDDKLTVKFSRPPPGFDEIKKFPSTECQFHSIKDASDILYSEVVKGLTLNRRLNPHAIDDSMTLDDGMIIDNPRISSNFQDRLTKSVHNHSTLFPRPISYFDTNSGSISTNQRQKIHQQAFNFNSCMYCPIYNNISQKYWRRFGEFSIKLIQQTFSPTYGHQNYFYGHSTTINSQSWLPASFAVQSFMTSSPTPWNTPNRSLDFGRHPRKSRRVTFEQRDLEKDPSSVEDKQDSPDELELQAIEQYSNSNENIFQELEKQAKEQYDMDDSP